MISSCGSTDGLDLIIDLPRKDGKRRDRGTGQYESDEKTRSWSIRVLAESGCGAHDLPDRARA
ncbi:hypothetical protein FRAAL4229 [Frankia alni ACN14a]|uniref:Uncharacterized protein n=1 Tax=Frankia alni (strain DSM 45986 / CECT 9034 / ACN14a) TaxID=326424 RepID=Q0RI01_FRAAA|nr:hypothetical protein FRAAL4229 [Frankia alni ACN14a]